MYGKNKLWRKIEKTSSLYLLSLSSSVPEWNRNEKRERKREEGDDEKATADCKKAWLFVLFPTKKNAGIRNAR
jgi:hypothetical protein